MLLLRPVRYANPKLFLKDFSENSANWENTTLEDFLSAMLSWVEDAEGYYTNIGELDVINNYSWRLFADILIASSMYE